MFSKKVLLLCSLTVLVSACGFTGEVRREGDILYRIDYDTGEATVTRLKGLPKGGLSTNTQMITHNAGGGAMTQSTIVTDAQTGDVIHRTGQGHGRYIDTLFPGAGTVVLGTAIEGHHRVKAAEAEKADQTNIDLSNEQGQYQAQGQTAEGGAGASVGDIQIKANAIAGASASTGPIVIKGDGKKDHHHKPDHKKDKRNYW